VSISGVDRGAVSGNAGPVGRVKEGGDMELKWGSGRLWAAALVALAAVAVVAADRGLRPEAAGAEAEEVGVSDYCELGTGMIMGAAGSTVWYNLKLRHPTLDMPIIDYDLALLFQPMLMLGISIGVAFNVIFADWMVTVLLIILFIGNRVISCRYPYDSDRRKSVWLRDLCPVVAEQINVAGPNHRKCLLEGAWSSLFCVDFIPYPTGFEAQLNRKVFLQVSSATATFAMTFSSSMSVVEYYLLKRFPIPYGNVLHLSILSACKMNQYLEFIAQQFTRFASFTCIKAYLILMSLLNWAALYFVSVALVAAFVGQHFVKRLIEILGRASLIIFILASTIFISAISLGKAKISHRLSESFFFGSEQRRS
ncbi:hypothetical protein BHE74_00005765, partial [Ensete ventricosum]